MLSSLIYTDILAIFVFILGVMNVISLLRYHAHIHKDVKDSLGIVIDTKTGKVMRTFDYNKNGVQWREVARTYADKLNKKGK